MQRKTFGEKSAMKTTGCKEKWKVLSKTNFFHLELLDIAYI